MTRLIANRAVCVFAVLNLVLFTQNVEFDAQDDKQAATTRGHIPELSQTVIDVVDINPDLNVFEASLSVDEQDVNIGGTTVHALIYKDLNNPEAYAGIPDGIPIPQIVVTVGDEIVVTLTNNLSNPCAAIACDTSIHWHGLELDNDSDGTGVNQNHLTPGETYTYRFKTFRPGIFWFHPHMKPGPQLFAGTYATFIIRDPNEAVLVAAAKIPSAANTHTVVLSDTEFDSSGDVGYLDAGSNAIPWATLRDACAAGDIVSCLQLEDPATVLVNGQKPDVAAETPMLEAMSGAGIRLRLVNASTHRYFRLKVSGNGTDDNLYRIGGEGGFLEYVRLEGGTLGSWVTKYLKGEILLPPSARTDVVIVPTGGHGDIIVISGIGFDRGGTSPMGENAAGDLLYIKIDNTLIDTPFAIAEGNDVLGSGGIEDIRSGTPDGYLDPNLGPGMGIGSSNETITMTGMMGIGVNGIDFTQGFFEDSGSDYTLVPYQAASRYAKTGDLLEITITHNTCQHHPFHHHGFSFQPVRILDAADATLYEFDYNEFVDVIDVPVLVGSPPCSAQKVVIRMRLDDRPRITDNRQEMGAPAPDQFFASGGAAGRWVFHCHMFVHAALGMISELVVLDTDRDGDGFDTSMDCDDTNDFTYPGAPEINDGFDNQCPGDYGYGVVDENTGVSGFQTQDNDAYSWAPQTGATIYEAARSNAPDFSSNCVLLTTADTTWYDAQDPLAGTVFFYLNRPIAPNVGSWGQAFGGERTFNCPN